LKNILAFLKSFTITIRETKNRGKLRLDLPFDILPSANILINNVIPNIRSVIYMRILVTEVPPDVLKLFEESMIFLNFRNDCIRADFKYFDELLLDFFKQFKILVYEERSLLMIFRKSIMKADIIDILDGRIEHALNEVFRVHEHITRYIAFSTGHIRFSRGDT
jgi:hypothetical protein